MSASYNGYREPGAEPIVDTIVRAGRNFAATIRLGGITGTGTVRLGAHPNQTADDPAQRVADAAYAALREIGRDDLADVFAVFTNDDGTPYLEHLDELDDADTAVLDKAEQVALEVLR